MEVTIGLWRESGDDSSLRKFFMLGEEFRGVGVEGYGTTGVEVLNVVLTFNSFLLLFRSVDYSRLCLVSSSLFLLISLFADLGAFTVLFRNGATHFKFLSGHEFLQSSSISPHKLILDSLNSYRPVVSMAELLNLSLILCAMFVNLVLDLLLSNDDSYTSSEVKFSHIDHVAFTSSVNLSFQERDGSVNLVALKPLLLDNALNAIFGVRDNLVFYLGHYSAE
jgi:hypothetical protein